MYEFKFRGYDPQQCELYLERIGAAYDGQPTLENLDMLIRLHQQTVPFENLALAMNWGTVDISPDALFQKIVKERRGGFCFELNGAFLLLLKGLGYDAVGVMARVGVPFLDELLPLHHHGIVVRMDGRQFYCDVGMGGPKADWAVEFTSAGGRGENACGGRSAGGPGENACGGQDAGGSGESVRGGRRAGTPIKTTRHGQTYWVEDTDEGWKMLKNQGSESDGSVIIFAPIAMLPSDFAANCKHLTDSGNSIFHQHRMVNVCREDGYIDVRDNTLKIASGDQVTQREFPEEEFDEILKKHFGIIRG